MYNVLWKFREREFNFSREVERSFTEKLSVDEERAFRRCE